MTNYTDQLAELRLNLGQERDTDPLTIANHISEQGQLRSLGQTQQLFDTLDAELNGLGPLETFVSRPGVSDVLVDPEGQIWVDGDDGMQRQDHPPLPEELRRKLATKIINQGGKRLDDSVPFADVNSGRYRFHAVIPPISGNGTAISIRVHQNKRHTLQDLAATWPDGNVWEAVMNTLVRERKNFLITGATGTGKTTLLGAALSAADPHERIIVVEDAQELKADHPQFLSLMTRPANVEGAGDIGLTDLIRQALRMRPDRLIVGECRGAEIKDFLTAMNTGHSGAGGTLHANSVGAVPARLTAMGALAELSPETTALQAGSAIDYVVHLRRDKQRRLPVEFAGLTVRDSKLAVVPVLTYSRETSQLECGDGWAEFASLMDGQP